MNTHGVLTLLPGGRCDRHTHCSDCATKRGRRRGNRRARQTTRRALRAATKNRDDR